MTFHIDTVNIQDLNSVKTALTKDFEIYKELPKDLKMNQEIVELFFKSF